MKDNCLKVQYIYRWMNMLNDFLILHYGFLDNVIPSSQMKRNGWGTICGQLNWMARQCRADLSFGVSRVQQLAGVDDPGALTELKILVERAKISATIKYENLGCDLRRIYDRWL